MGHSPRAQVGAWNAVGFDPGVLRGDPVAELGFKCLFSRREAGPALPDLQCLVLLCSQDDRVKLTGFFHENRFLVSVAVTRMVGSRAK